MDKTPTLSIGEQFGRFTISDVLPSGGQGELYRAKDPKLQRDVAIKLLLGSDTHDHERFTREAITAAGFSHPNIVGIYELETEHRHGRDIPYIVMEFIEGETLKDRMRTATKEQCLRWLAEVADGLAAMHPRGVVHRDLKPANIMIGTADDRARIVDFGLAKTDGSTVTSSNTIVGTVDYFSPEQAHGLRRLDFRTDIFSFGIILYEALTGRHPFRRATNVHTMHAITVESPGPIDGRVGEIAAKCLEKTATDRYDDASDIARQIRELPSASTRRTIPSKPLIAVDPDAITAKATTEPNAPRVMPSPRRWRLIVLMTPLLLAVILIAYMQKAGPDAQRPLQTTTSSPFVTQQPAALATGGLTASPGTINYGGSSRLNWRSSNAVDRVISPTIGLVGSNGSVEVAPRVTTTYHLVVTDASGNPTESSVTVVVTGAPDDLQITPATGSITASPATISHKGEVAMLGWNSFGATHVVITPSIGIVPLQGRIQVEPLVTTTYTMTLSNDTGDSAPRTPATVYVDPVGAPTGIVANPSLVVDCVSATQPGTVGTLDTNSTSCSVPAHRTVTQAVLNYVLDDGGSISINGRNVFTRTVGVGARDGSVTLPVEMFPPNKSFLVKVVVRNAVNPDGTPAGEVYGKAAVRLITQDAMPAVEMGVTPGSIKQGETAYIDWSSIDATTLVLNPLIGLIEPRGRIAVSPTRTTTYTIRGWNGSGDPATAQITLEVQ